MNKSKYVIGVDIGGTSIKGAILNSRAEIFFSKTVKTLSHRDSKHILKDIDLLIRECEGKACESNINITGIGIILPGYPDKNGIVSFIPNILSLTNFPIKKYLCKNRKTPIIFENDGNAAAYGEYIFGQEKKFRNIVVLTLGTGIGSGVIVDGKVLRGRDEISGELGHITLNPGGLKCLCGKRGCLEAYFSAYAIKRFAKEVVRENHGSTLRNYKLEEIEPSIVTMEARNGDKASKYIYKCCGEWLGVGISVFVNVFNPDKVILAGGISKAGDLFMEPMMDEIKKNVHPQYYKNINIEISRFTDNLGIISTASLVLN